MNLLFHSGPHQPSLGPLRLWEPRGFLWLLFLQCLSKFILSIIFSYLTPAFIQLFSKAQQTSWHVIWAHMDSSNLIYELVSCWCSTKTAGLFILCTLLVYYLCLYPFLYLENFVLILTNCPGPSKIFQPGVILSFFLNSHSTLCVSFMDFIMFWLIL